MIKKGVYAAGLSVLNDDRTLNIDATINHATQAIQNGLHGIFFFGSTGQSQLISTNEKKELITRIANHKLKKQFFDLKLLIQKMLLMQYLKMLITEN